jgi:hypothetical protein
LASTVIFSQKETRPCLEEIENKTFQTFQGRIAAPFFQTETSLKHRRQYLSVASHPFDIV